MEYIVEKIKRIWAALVDLYGSKDEIKDIEGYYAVKRWMKLVKRVHITRFIMAMILCFIMIIVIGALTNPGIAIAFGVIFVPIMAYTSCGFAAKRLYRAEVRKSMINGAIDGYKIGSQFETTHVTVRHEFGNTYRVDSRTDNDGCLFAVFGAAISTVIWAFFCAYLAPYLTLKKYKANKEELLRYEAENKIA